MLKASTCYVGVHVISYPSIGVILMWPDRHKEGYLKIVQREVACHFSVLYFFSVWYVRVLFDREKLLWEFEYERET